MAVLNPFYQSDDDVEDEEHDISNGNDIQGDENGNNTKERTQHYKTATNEDKLKILEIAKEIGNSKAARMFNITRTNIIYWRKQENKIRTIIVNKNGKKRSFEDTVDCIEF